MGAPASFQSRGLGYLREHLLNILYIMNLSRPLYDNFIYHTEF